MKNLILSIACLCCNFMIIGYCYYARPARIVTFDINHLIKELTIEERSLSEVEFAKLSEHYLSQAERVLSQLALKKNLIVLPKNAIIAGQEDITDAVMKKIREQRG